MNITTRTPNPQAEHQLKAHGIHPLLARLMAARGIHSADELNPELNALLNPNTLKGIDTAAQALADFVLEHKKIVVVGDYDCDGATATAVAVRGLRMLHAALGTSPQQAKQLVQFVVPNRFKYGYGLSPEIVALTVQQHAPDVLVTVDNGIASVDGIEAAKALGVPVIVTDHHLPGPQLPDALAIVNPNQPGCPFISKNMAGVGVMFYVLLATRAVLRTAGHFTAQSQPRLDGLLDLVALGTVADVVKLCPNNRRLVAQGLMRIRKGLAQPGIIALMLQAGRDPRRANTFDLGFAVGPRLNAAGRLADMSIGIQALITDNAQEANALAQQLAAMNETRKRIEADMKNQALEHLGNMLQTQTLQAGLVVYHPNWHQGVIGILASRIKEQFHRPVIALAQSDNPAELKGSGRSIPGVHLRDVLDLVAKRLPTGSMPKMGGHAMAAGLTLNASVLSQFECEFAKAIETLADPEALAQTWVSDGSLPAQYLNPNTADMLELEVWGQGFAPPLFCDEFEVLEHRLLKDTHSKFKLRREGQVLTALRWRSIEPLPPKAQLLYRFERDVFSGGNKVQLILEAICKTT